MFGLPLVTNWLKHHERSNSLDSIFEKNNDDLQVNFKIDQLTERLDHSNRSNAITAEIDVKQVNLRSTQNEHNEQLETEVTIPAPHHYIRRSCAYTVKKKNGS